MINKEEKSWTNHRKNWITNEVKEWITGKNCEMNEDTWEDLDTLERRDHEPIKDHLNEAPVKYETDNWQLRMNKPELTDSG